MTMMRDEDEFTGKGVFDECCFFFTIIVLELRLVFFLEKYFDLGKGERGN